MNNALSHLLKEKKSIFDAFEQKHTWHNYAVQFLLISIVGIAAYAAVMSTYAPSWSNTGEMITQLLTTILLPILICAPSLYVFSAIRGSQITALQLMYILLGSVATSSIVLLAFAPITWFFTWTMEDADAVGAMNVGLIALGMLFGFVFLYTGFAAFDVSGKEEKKMDAKQAMVARLNRAGGAIGVLFVWCILLIVVTAQMANELGPWFTN